VEGFGDDPTISGVGEQRQSGDIYQFDWLPSISFVYEFAQGITFRAAASETIARPSFRELNPTIVRDSVGGDQVVGEADLQMSQVRNFDLRLDWFNQGGDLASVSLFLKRIQEPIEETRVAGRTTFQNNPNTATVRGVEVELRKGLGFINLDSFSIGANATYIDAEVRRPQDEIDSVNVVLGGGAPETRRLEDQPEWIVNADIRFLQPDWGTDATLALFWISDRLDVAAGTSPTERDLDRFEQSYHTLDFSISQRLAERWSVKFSAKNLTDSVREVLIAPELTNETLIYSQTRKGRSYSLSASYSF